MLLYVKSARFCAVLFALILLAPLRPVHLAATPDPLKKLDSVLKGKARHRLGYTRVIVRFDTSHSQNDIGHLIRELGGKLGRKLPAISSQVAFVPNAALDVLAASPLVERVSHDRPVVGTMERTAAAIGASAVRQSLGANGAGIGLAVIDSGVAWHDDLSDAGVGQRVVEFVDFVNGVTVPYDDYGHGTHVAGVIAGNGRDSDGARTGIAPEAHLVVLKVLDDNGRGYISDVIAAIDYAIERRAALNLRVINLSVGAGVYESYATDPLTVAAGRAVRAGITVVAAAGNQGRGVDGRVQYGGTTSPGNAPWVLTVGASTHMGTVDRSDDRMASFSSRGPTAIDRLAKPDLVAPGVGIESLAAPGSTLYARAADYLLPGTTTDSAHMPYVSLSGTSVAAPVVSGTVALMMQVNPSLTPNAVKAILQYTAEVSPGYDPLTQGAGFVNAKGAVELARYLANSSNIPYPNSSGWSANLIWGNQRVAGGRLAAMANAWSTNVNWGAALAPDGQRISWGNLCKPDDCTSTTGKWRFDSGQNVVWGAVCNGADCDIPWSLALFSRVDGATVVWGTTDSGETVVWGTDDGETVVWGTADDGETVVWGTGCAVTDCQPTVWSRR